MIELAGLAISGIGLLTNLLKQHKDLSKWEEKDIEVDSEWLQVAIEKGVVDGPMSELGWMSERRLPTAELKRTHAAIIAVNEEKRIKYRIVQGRPGDRNVLVRKTAAAT